MFLDNYSDNNFGPDQILATTCFKTSNPDGPTQIFKTETGPASYKPESVYTYFKTAADKYKKHPALVIQRNGLWKTWSYEEYFKESCLVAKAFIKLGLERFHGVCIMGFNNPEWMMASFGAVFAGGFSAGVYTTNSPEACLYIADNCDAQIIVVEDDACLSKFLAVKRNLPNVKAIIQWSGKPTSPDVLTWAELLAIGLHEPDEILSRRLSLAAINQCCTLIYTSGTTGPPKGVMLNQDHMTWGAKQYYRLYDVPLQHEVLLSFLPLSHLAAHMGEIYIPLFVGATVYFATPDVLKGTLGEWLLTVKPTCFYGVPRIWEKIYEKLQEFAVDAGFFKRNLGAWAKAQGSNYYKALVEGRDLSLSERMKFSVAKTLVFDRLRDALGLERSPILISGSAPIDPSILEYFYSLNLPIPEIYGLSETLSFCSMNFLRPREFRIGSVGKVLDLTEVTLMHSDELRKGEGEICIRGRNICMGYLKKPDKTDEAIDDEGWMHTGDLGWIDSEGFLFITGRLKELVITAGGENIPPILIEDAIKKELPCVSCAMLIGDKRKYLSILLTLKSEINMDTGEPLQELTQFCQNWMSNNGCNAKTVMEALNEIKNNPNGALVQAIQQGIERYNTTKAVSNAQKIQRWAILPHDFTIATEELNSTFKLKRSFVLEKYTDAIEGMYSSLDKLKSKL